jgi:hypothetical protein
MCQRGTWPFLANLLQRLQRLKQELQKSPGGTSVRCFKQIWKVGKVGKVHIGKVGVGFLSGIFSPNRDDF